MKSDWFVLLFLSTNEKNEPGAYLVPKVVSWRYFESNPIGAPPWYGCGCVELVCGEG
jgi:hypothetical protein